MRTAGSKWKSQSACVCECACVCTCACQQQTCQGSDLCKLEAEVPNESAQFSRKLTRSVVFNTFSYPWLLICLVWVFCKQREQALSSCDLESAAFMQETRLCLCESHQQSTTKLFAICLVNGGFFFSLGSVPGSVSTNQRLSLDLLPTSRNSMCNAAPFVEVTVSPFGSSALCACKT